MRLLRFAAYLLIIGMLTAYGVMTYQLRTRLLGGYSDFISAYTAGKILQRSAAERLYDLQLQYSIQQEAAPDVRIRHGALPYVRPPFEAWLFRPLAEFSYATAFATWDAIGLAMLIVSLVLLRREVAALQSVSWVLFFLGAISFFPVYLTFLQGQDSIVLLLVYSLTYVALRRERDFVAGAILALGTFKFPLVLPFLVTFMLQRRGRFLAGFATGCAALLAISAATVGMAGLRQYVIYLANIDQLAAGVNVPRDMPNLRGLLAVFSEAYVSSGVGKTTVMVISLLLIGWAAHAWSTKAGGSDVSLSLGFALNLIVTTLVSYHDHIFDLALLVIPLCFSAGMLMSGPSLSSGNRRLLSWSAGAVAFSPLYLVLSFGVRATGLVAVLLLLFAEAIARTMAEQSSGALSQEHGSAGVAP